MFKVKLPSEFLATTVLVSLMICAAPRGQAQATDGAMLIVVPSVPPKAALPAPKEVKITSTGTWTGISWKPVAKAKLYIVKRATASGPFTEIARVSEPKFVDTFGSIGGPWRYEVQTSDGTSISAASAVVPPPTPQRIGPSGKALEHVSAYFGVTGSVAPPPATVPDLHSLEQDLLADAGENDVAGFQHLLSIGVDPDAKRSDGYNALMMAAESKSDAVLTLLISRHVSLDDTDAAHETALFIAARAGNIDGVRDLVHAGATVDKANASGVTPLMIAAAENHGDVVDELVRDGSVIDAQDNYENTALIVAAKAGAIDAVASLIAAKANVNIRNTAGQTALGAADQAGHADVAALIAKAGGYE